MHTLVGRRAEACDTGAVLQYDPQNDYHSLQTQLVDQNDGQEGANRARLGRQDGQLGQRGRRVDGGHPMGDAPKPEGGHSGVQPTLSTGTEI